MTHMRSRSASPLPNRNKHARYLLNNPLSDELRVHSADGHLHFPGDLPLRRISRMQIADGSPYLLSKRRSLRRPISTIGLKVPGIFVETPHGDVCFVTDVRNDTNCWDLPISGTPRIAFYRKSFRRPGSKSPEPTHEENIRFLGDSRVRYHSMENLAKETTPKCQSPVSTLPRGESLKTSRRVGLDYDVIENAPEEGNNAEKHVQFEKGSSLDVYQLTYFNRCQTIEYKLLNSDPTLGFAWISVKEEDEVTTNKQPVDPPGFVQTSQQLPYIRVNRLYEVEPPAPSAPPLNEMEEVSGYENATFVEATIPPPVEEKKEGGAEKTNLNREPIVPSFVTEKLARQMLINYAKDHFCHGTKPAKDMSLTFFKYTTAFHYELQTFTEKRETGWKFAPYRGTEIDGSENGPAPLPWAITATPAKLFKNEEQFIKVPHTESVRPCHMCRSSGTIMCSSCSGKGWIRCHICSGRGHCQTGEVQMNCTSCSYSHFGKGKMDCHKCEHTGKISCPTCEGNGHILCYIGLTVSWRNRSSEYVVDYDTVPEKIIRQVTGQVQYEEEGIRVQPIVNAPDEAVGMASLHFNEEHIAKAKGHHILAQRQQLRIVPITTIRYNWKKSEGVFYLCGYENRVYAPNYPQSCCCCCHCGSRCSIL